MMISSGILDNHPAHEVYDANPRVCAGSFWGPPGRAATHPLRVDDTI